MAYKVYLNGKTINKGYADSWFKRLEEEEEKKAEQQIIENQKQSAQKEEENNKPWWQMIGDAAGATGNFIKDAAVDVYDTGKSSVLGNKDIIEGQVAAGRTEQSTENMKKIGEERSKYLASLKDEDFDKPEVKRKLAEFQKAADGAGQSDDDRREMQESQNVDTTKVAADTAETFLNVATAGTGLGIKALAKQGAKKGMTLTAKQLEKAGAKEIAKATARGAGEGAVFSGAAGLTDAVSEDMTGEEAVGNIASAAAFGGILGGASSGVARGVDVRKNNKAVDAQTAATNAQNAEIANVDGAADAAADAITNPYKDLTDDDLMTQVKQFASGEGRTDDIQGDYQRIQGVKDELSSRERSKYFENGGVDVETARKQLEEFDAGNVPPEAMKPAAPVASINEVLERKDIPVEIKNAAAEVEADRRMIDEQMDGLMSPQVKEAQIDRLNETYDLKVKELQQRYASLEEPTKAKDGTVDQTVSGQRLSGEYKSDVRYTVAKDRLDEEYKEAIAELDMLEAEDMDEVAKFSQMLDAIEGREQAILLDTRNLMKSAPDQFLDIDDVEAGAIRAKLEKQLQDAERFSTPEGVVTEVATSPDPVKSFDNNPSAEPAFKQKVSEEIDSIPDTTLKDNFKHIGGVKQSVLMMMSPSQVLAKMGLRGENLDIHSNILRAESAVNLANRADSEVLTRISQALPDNKQVQSQIIDYLEGKRETLSAIQDREAADMIRKWLDEKRASIKEMGFEGMDDYFPHMIDKNDPKVGELFKGKTNAELSFGNLKKRMEDRQDYSRDIMDVLTKYASSHNRKKFLEPAIKPLDDLKKQVELEKAEIKWVDAYINQLKGFNSSAVGDGYNAAMDGLLEKMGRKGSVGKDHYTATLGTQRMISAAATMGLNPGTAIRNMTQMVNTVADIGPRYSTIGAWQGAKALRAGKGSVEWKELERVGIMDGGVSQNYFDAITKPGVVGRTARGRDVAVKGMMSLIRGTDISLRAQAYYGAKALARDKGLTGQAIEDFAMRKVIDTQFITSRVDMPPAFNGQGVRSLTQLATFSGKQAGFLKRMGVKMVKGSDGTFSMKDAGSVMAAVITAGVATEALKPLMGFRETEWIPFYDQIAPFAGAFGIDAPEGGDSLYRSPLVRLLAGDGKSKMGLIQAAQTGDWAGLIEDQWSSVIPAGTQIKKTWEGATTTGVIGEGGVSKNSKGNIRYLQDMDVDDQLKASIFGQYSTEAGQDWIRSGFPTLTDKQTATVNGLGSREEKERYVDYYAARKSIDYEVETDEGTKRGRQAAYDQVKEAAAAGDTNKAKRIADEFNEAVTQSMASYWKKHEDMPQELQDEMLSGLYINVGRVIDKINKE